MNPAPTNARRVHQLPPQCDGVVQIAQHEQASTGRDAGKRPGARTGRDDQPVVVGEGAVGKRDAPEAKVDGRGAHAKPHIERERAVPVFPAEKGVLRLQRALEQLLRERWTVVGAMRFLADERQLTVEAPGAQCLGCAQPREGGANDSDSAQHRSLSFFDRDRSGWTLAHSLVHFRAQALFGRFDQDVQHAIVANLEHFGRRLHAETVEVARVQIYNDSHVSLLLHCGS
jgi:hypothetical protein